MSNVPRYRFTLADLSNAFNAQFEALAQRARSAWWWLVASIGIRLGVGSSVCSDGTCARR